MGKLLVASSLFTVLPLWARRPCKKPAVQSNHYLCQFSCCTQLPSEALMVVSEDAGGKH